MSNTDTNGDPEFDAMVSVYVALKDLEPDAQRRVLDYVFKRLSLNPLTSDPERAGSTFSPRELAKEESLDRDEGNSHAPRDVGSAEDMQGISPVAQKWIRRNGLSPDKLSKYFSLGIDEIDLVAKSVPGTSKREKMHNVILLIGTASYLGEGAARFSYDALKEALGHYNAYDGSNFAAYIKDFAPEVSGTKDSGYTLTGRGLAAAVDLLKQMIGEK